jgi:5-methyltetrahydropteroyltriglutamate--homocysteine methyltransferase
LSHQTSNLGYPRIGENREWKKLLESFWSGKLEEETFQEEMKNIRLRHLQKQKERGIDLIPVGDFTFYDHMLDMSAMLGLVPARYGYSGGRVPLSTYFAMARGNQEAPACEMTKWFNTNYHYIVPEIEDKAPVLTENRPLIAYREAKELLGIEGKPVIVGPFTFLKLSKGYAEEQFAERLEPLIAIYAQVLSELQEEGVPWVQIDEPYLATDVTPEDMNVVANVYARLHESAPKLNIMLQTYFDAIDYYPELCALPVQGIGLDFVHGREVNLGSLEAHGFPQDKVLGVGIVDGRNVWRSDLGEKADLLEKISAIVPEERLIVQPSSSLLHVPVHLQKETKLSPFLRNAMAYADEKLDEVSILAQALHNGRTSVSSQLEASKSALAALDEARKRTASGNQAIMPAEDGASDKRGLSFDQRRLLQQQKWLLPALPTTTIGSFPQTAEVRQARQRFRKGEWSQERYSHFIKDQIKDWIHIQEDIGLDVLVHGEFERTDMVEFFGEKLDGFAFTQGGWVQSYGSRCVKPPVIFGDVAFAQPMTVEETVYAQSLTSKPVKGMLTGPITILNWSFVRDDISRKEVAQQIAFALRSEVEALEAAGIEMIQVDEPALREGLPLKRNDWDEYLAWAVQSFRLSTSTVKNTTQIHTHMCYCEFHDIIDAIRELDADVISIETSRSHGELISSFETHTYDKGIGLGVYDIHSPRVPDAEEMLRMIERALRVLPAGLFWINPDCGLKTRGKEETVASLIKMVEVAREVRTKLAAAN